MTTPIPEVPNPTPNPNAKSAGETPLIYAVDGAMLPSQTQPNLVANKDLLQNVADNMPTADQYQPSQHWLGAATTTKQSADAPQNVTTGAVTGGAMLESGLTTVAMANFIARGIRTGDDGRWWIFPSRYGIGTNGRDILARYGNLGAILNNEPDQNTGRLIPVTRIVRAEGLIGVTDAVTGKKVTQIDLSNPTLSLDATHQTPYVTGDPANPRKSFYDTFNAPLDHQISLPNGTTRHLNYTPTQEYLAHHGNPDLSGRGLIDHIDIVSSELRAHEHVSSSTRLRGNEVDEVAQRQRELRQELQHASDELRSRVIDSPEFKDYLRLRGNEDLFERTTLFNGIGDDAMFQKNLFLKRFLAGSTVMGIESVLYDAKNAGLGVHSIPGIALTTLSAAAWTTVQGSADSDKLRAWTITKRAGAMGIGSALTLSAVGLFNGEREYSNTPLGGLLNVIPEPTETEAIFIGTGMAIPTKNVAGKLGVIGGAAVLGWGVSQIAPHPIETFLEGR